MKTEDKNNLVSVPEGISLFDAIRIACLAFGTPAKDEDEEDRRDFDENGKPIFLLFDEIWEIIDEAGHGTPIIIHHYGTPSEVVIYNRYATQDENMKFIGHIYDALEEGLLVTINGTDIYDLY